MQNADDLAVVIMNALEGLAFAADDISERIVEDQVLSHLRHHPNALQAWHEFQDAYDYAYEAERFELDEKKRAAANDLKKSLLNKMVEIEIEKSKPDGIC